MLTKPEPHLLRGSTGHAFELWIRTGVARRVEGSRDVWSLRHIWRTPLAFEVELVSESATLWLRSASDEIVGIDWRQRPAPGLPLAEHLWHLYDRVSDAGINVQVIDDILVELDERREELPFVFRDANAAVEGIELLRRLRELGGALAGYGDCRQTRATFEIGDVRATLLARWGRGARRDEPPPPRLVADVLAISPADQALYELITNGAPPARTELATIPHRGPFYRWIRTPEHAEAYYGTPRRILVAGTRAARLVEDRRGGFRVVEETRPMLACRSLPYWAEYFAGELRDAISALADVRSLYRARQAVDGVHVAFASIFPRLQLALGARVSEDPLLSAPEPASPLGDPNGTNPICYDDQLPDALSHPDVVTARKAGRAWADREEVPSDSEWPPGGFDELGWNHDTEAALAIVARLPRSDGPRDERALAEICDNAAAERWAEIISAHEEARAEACAELDGELDGDE